MLDIIFLASNRLRFTQASLEALRENTNWQLVRRLFLYDDGSVDGTDALIAQSWWPVSTSRIVGKFGGPVAVMNDYLAGESDEFVVKVDNDAMVPAGWLDAAERVMDEYPELDLLGLEPPSSTVRIPGIGKGYIPTDSIGGIGLMRAEAFRRTADPMIPHSTYGGFTDWQKRHPEVLKGWMAPSLNLFLLDRLPMEPWASLSREYVLRGWQRPWKQYTAADEYLWSWHPTISQRGNQ